MSALPVCVYVKVRPCQLQRGHQYQCYRAQNSDFKYRSHSNHEKYVLITRPRLCAFHNWSLITPLNRKISSLNLRFNRCALCVHLYRKVYKVIALIVSDFGWIKIIVYIRECLTRYAHQQVNDQHYEIILFWNNQRLENDTCIMYMITHILLYLIIF